MLASVLSACVETKGTNGNTKGRKREREKGNNPERGREQKEEEREREGARGTMHRSTFSHNKFPPWEREGMT